MKNIKKRSISLLLALFLLLTAVPGHVFADDTETVFSPSDRDATDNRIEKLPFWRQDKSNLPQNAWTDVEGSYYWDNMAHSFKRSGNWSEDLLCIAASQLGYRESKLNYREDDNGFRRGYTRYGAWYGDTYGEWCAMFVCFCMHYAGISDEIVPYEANCNEWVKKLWRKDLFVYSALAEPKLGDLIFLGDVNGAYHMGIICSFDTEKGETVYIQGNDLDKVSRGRIASDSTYILGYGVLPVNPARSAEAPCERIVRAFEQAFSSIG